ncbi:MAG: hypothetical protein A2494_00080 [Candidatus Lloydbacteria bacterium RIFOXYC12_FULL_46_25]|uniref:Uncharacterized protein n=1 Tax=Candidatus Lloydbacteria bacterium RIFOXYC12_FULL_46_25 TaxID=1798670 RepID=A0A1G2E386_9BACT|nr:MAG: hypothetical protein A2494_00080 [Candidatus Lloydbacteria bacterium RIFOXYC12_FULL_46_25]
MIYTSYTQKIHIKTFLFDTKIVNLFFILNLTQYTKIPIKYVRKIFANKMISHPLHLRLIFNLKDSIMKTLSIPA